MSNAGLIPKAHQKLYEKKQTPRIIRYGVFIIQASPDGADDEARTRYLHLGKVALYQMSYIRKSVIAK